MKFTAISKEVAFVNKNPTLFPDQHETALQSNAVGLALMETINFKTPEMKKQTLGFVVETEKDKIRITMGDEPHENGVLITAYDVENLISMLQEAKTELLGINKKISSRNGSSKKGVI